MARLAGLIAAVVLLAGTVEAAGIQSGAIGCDRATMYSQMLRAARAGDSATVQRLIDDGLCVIIPSAAEVTVLEEALADRWRIEFAIHGTTQTVWVAPEMVTGTSGDH